jgi:hypothetical protein
MFSSMIDSMDLSARTALIAAKVSLACRQSSQSPTEAVLDSRRLVNWVETPHRPEQQEFRLGSLALALEYRVSGATLDKILVVSQMIYESKYPPPPPPKPSPESAVRSTHKKKASKKKGVRRKKIAG